MMSMLRGLLALQLGKHDRPSVTRTAPEQFDWCALCLILGISDASCQQRHDWESLKNAQCMLPVLCRVPAL